MAKNVKVLVTGATGQDGAYLAKLLVDRGFEVIAGVRRASTTNDWRLREFDLTERLRYVSLELLEFSNIVNVIREHRPSMIFNLAAQSFVAASFQQPLYTADVDALGAMRFLEAIRLVDPSIRFYQASTSEMFGKVVETPQTEATAFYPRSPYGVAKLFAHWSCVNYRESYGMFASSGILFNHESPLRGREFVSRKITSHFALMGNGLETPLTLGNLDSKRDWGHARDYVAGMLAMMEAPQSDTFVLASGATHSVRSFVERAAGLFGFDLVWEGKGDNETGIDRKSNRVIVRVSSEFYRPAEVDLLLGNPAKAKRELGWTAATTFEALVEDMVRADRDRVARNQPLL